MMNLKDLQTNTNLKRFTIVELLVGMTILSMLMLMMFRFVLSSQRTLELNDSMWRIYENSRIIFDLIERDLQSTVVSDTPNRTIGFYLGNPSLNADGNAQDDDDPLHLCFVASTEPPDAATSRLCEINYAHHVDESASTSDPFVLYRKLTCDNDSTYWDFENQPSSWYQNSKAIDTPKGIWTNYQKVVGGVASFSIDCFDDSGTQISAGSEATTTPTRVEVNIEVFDPKLSDAPEVTRLKTQRAFTKIFFLSHLED